MSKATTFLSCIFGATLLLAGPAHAAYVTIPAVGSNGTDFDITNDADGKNGTGIDWNIACSLGCTLLGVSAPVAGWEAELNLLNSLAGTSFTKDAWPDSLHKQNSGGSNVFAVDELFVWFKGGDTLLAVFENTGGTGNEFTFTKFGNAAGLSHVAHVGEVGEVPLPGTLGLLGLGLAGLGTLRRKQVRA